MAEEICLQATSHVIRMVAVQVTMESVAAAVAEHHTAEVLAHTVEQPQKQVVVAEDQGQQNMVIPLGQEVEEGGLVLMDIRVIGEVVLPVMLSLVNLIFTS